MLLAAVIFAVSIIAAGFTFNYANDEEVELTARLQSRAQILSESLAESIGPSYRANSTTTLERIIERFADRERTAGIVLVDASGASVAASPSFPGDALEMEVIDTAMSSGEAQGDFLTRAGQSYYLFAQPILDEGRVTGALVTMHDAQYIDAAIWNIWRDSLVRLALQVALFSAAIFILVQLVFRRAIHELTESIRSVRSGTARETRGSMSILRPLSQEITKMSASLHQARTAASEEARMRLEKLDTPWTAERLTEFIKAYVKDRPIYVLANRAPYIHRKTKAGIEYSTPAGGVVTALEPMLQACGGMWLAHGSGDADKVTADKDGKIRVPPEEPSYTLKRIFLTEDEVRGYYSGFSSEALWPLCHMAHVRPLFRKEDWQMYKKVNAKFAKSLLEEIRHVDRPLVLVQDYHLALVPALIKKSRPDARVAMFWHIPWPSAAQFSICPWRAEILDGMLGADIVGFHTQQYCNNFMDTVGSEVESRIDFENFSINREEHRSYIRPFPISIAYPGSAEPHAEPDRLVLDALSIKTEFLALGVDRLDYIKGFLERFKGVEFFLEAHPEYRERFSLLQIASPTRESVEKYREYAAEVETEAARINAKYGTPQWQPIHFEHKLYSHKQLQPLYQLADVCMVTSLHDGMNLVAKEYVAARIDDAGVLMLSQFTGASRDLKGAIHINPYSAEETSEALHKALTMTKTEQHRRMHGMRASIRDYNIYRWSAEIIKALISLD